MKSVESKVLNTSADVRAAGILLCRSCVDGGAAVCGRFTGKCAGRGLVGTGRKQDGVRDDSVDRAVTDPLAFTAFSLLHITALSDAILSLSHLSNFQFVTAETAR